MHRTNENTDTAKRKKFQRGSIEKVPTNTGFTWKLRYYKDGKKLAMTLGTNIDLPTEDAANRKAAEQLSIINDNRIVYTFGHLLERYIAEALPDRAQTGASYKSLLKHIKVKWADVPLDVMLKDLMAIQTWLSELKTRPTKDRNNSKGQLVKGRPARPLSKATKQHIKALLHRVLECGMRWGMLPIERNPISLIEVKTPKGTILPKKRLKVPLAISQVQTLMRDEEMSEHVRVMVKLAIGLGLRISEILGLRWDDINFNGKVVTIERSSVGKHLGDAKTETSRSVMPLHDYLVVTLLKWREDSPEVNGWVFGNLLTGRPFHRDSLQADHLLTAGRRCGIPSLGWHTFRHTHIALLRQASVTPEVQMMMMRHANIETTNEYGRDGGSLELKRPANEAVMKLLLSGKE